MSSENRGKRPNFDKTSFRWLEQNYVRIKGLRNWTWKTIVEGIIDEHLNQIKMKGEESEQINAKYVGLIWHTFLRLAGITNLRVVPNVRDPES